MTVDGTARGPDEPEQPFELFGEVFDLADEAVNRVTDDELEARLSALLGGTGHHCPVVDAELNAFDGFCAAESELRSVTGSPEPTGWDLALVRAARREADEIVATARREAEVRAAEIRRDAQVAAEARKQAERLLAEATTFADAALDRAAKIVAMAREQAARIVADAEEIAKARERSARFAAEVERLMLVRDLADFAYAYEYPVTSGRSWAGVLQWP